MIVTPINKIPKSKSNINYREQIQREKCGLQVLWNDTKLNKARIGDFFGFIHNDRIITFRIVESIHISVSLNNVLCLGPIVNTMLWEDWIFYGGSKKVKKTINVKTNVEHLIRYLNQWNE